jgi:mono/diheme cytochrome c family protein
MGAGPSDISGDPEAAAKAEFERKVQPILRGACVACHAATASVGPAFLQPMPDIYSTVRAWPNLVKGGRPSDSRLYTYPTSPNHSLTGTNLTPSQADIIRRWIDVVPPLPGEEGEDATSETELLTPREGENEVSLADLGDGLHGARLTFVGDQLTTGFLITRLTAHAGAAGLHLVHPLFIVWCGQTVTPVDAFDGVDLEIEPNLEGTIGGGVLSLSSFTPGCQYSVHFELLEPSAGGDGGDGDGGGIVTGGCTSVASFTANARPQFSANCVRCHGMPGSTPANAFDMTSMDDLSAEGQALACGQVRSNVNLTAPEMSIIFRRVEPGQMTGHMFEFPTAGDFATFAGGVLAWVASEAP